MSGLNEFESKFRRLAELRQQKDIDEKAFERSKQEFQAYEAELMEELDNSGIRGSQTIDFGGDLGTVRFTKRKPTIYGTIVDLDKAKDKLDELGRLEEIMTESVMKKQLNEFVKAELEAGRDLPDGFGYYERRGITISHINK